MSYKDCDNCYFENCPEQCQPCCDCNNYKHWVRKSGDWIPCSVKLPEEEGWYLVTVKREYIDGTIEYKTESDLYAIELAEMHGHKAEFCKNGEYRSKVIAWMPEPEPYKGE